MKFLLHFLVAIAILSDGLPESVRAADLKPTAVGATMKWNVEVEVLMVALPEEKALALLPDLRDDAKIDAASAQLLDAVKHKEARLTGYLVAYSNNGQRALSATNVEKIYPTQYDGSASPTGFEKRNLGPSLDAECQVSENGEWIQMTVQIQRSELLQFDPYSVSPREGSLPKIEQPLFFCLRDTQHLALHSGHQILAGVHKLTKPDGEMELFVLRVTAAAAH